MPVCKFCAVPFAWGQKEDGGWVPLVPVGEEGALERDYQDEHGALRAGHRQICKMPGGPSVRVAKLAKAVPAETIIGIRPDQKLDKETGEITDVGQVVPGEA